MGCGHSLQHRPGPVHPHDVYAQSADDPRKASRESVLKHFPGALTNQEFLDRLRKANTTLGLTKQNTLFGHSLCPDEINHEKGDISQLLEELFGEVFTFGGLAGIPFVGKTGFGAFSHHRQDGGNLFIMFAPHVAVMAGGKVGYYLREGQHHESTACGAAMGAYVAVKDLEQEPEVRVEDGDFEMDYIKRGIWRHRERISKAPVPEVEIAQVTYEMVREMMLKIVNPKAAEGGKIILLGGIQINAKPDDYFLPLFLQSFEGGSTEPKDLFSTL